MPRRKKAAMLPVKLREALDRKLVESSFSDYRGLADWLADQGYAIGKTALHRYGKDLERRIERSRAAADAAKAWQDGVPDGAGAMEEATLRLALERMFALMLASETDDMQELEAASRTLAALSRAALTLRRVQREAARIAGRSSIPHRATEPGVDPQKILKFIREKVYGLDGDPEDLSAARAASGAGHARAEP